MVKQLCEHYKLHHIRIQDVIDEAIEKLVSCVVPVVSLCFMLYCSCHGQVMLRESYCGTECCIVPVAVRLCCV